jgi:hypothetical protein
MLQGKSAYHIAGAHDLGDILPCRAGPAPSRLPDRRTRHDATGALLRRNMVRSGPAATPREKLFVQS